MDAPTTTDKNILDLKVERTDFEHLLEDRRKEKKFTDVQLQVGDQLFDAHRVILSLYSPVLEAAISDQWSTTKVVPISDEYVDPSIVEPLLHFLYTGSIQLTPDNVHPVCVAAHFLQIKTLLEHSVRHLCRMINDENVSTFFEFSVNCQLRLLRFHCLRIIAKNHEKVLQDSQILKFSSSIFNDLIAGLKKQNRPKTMLKENTFDCIVRWTEVNLSERLDELPGLLMNIPLEELPLKFLTETVSNHQLVEDSISCIEAVSETLEKAEPEREDNLVLLCRHGQKMACYDSETKVWKNLPDMLEERSDFAVTVVNRKDIVVCGGGVSTHSEWKSCMSSLGYIEMFDWTSQTWKHLPRMPKFSGKPCSVAAFYNHLYVIGKGEHGENKRVLRYSLETHQWQDVQPMNIARSSINNTAKLVEYDGYLYVFGGGTNTVERYDPLFDEWTCIDDGPKSLNHEQFDQMLVHQNKIYAFNSRYFEKFDPETNQWSQRSEWDCRGSIVSTNGRLFLAKDRTKWIYEFDLPTKKWIEFVEHELNDFIYAFNLHEMCFLFAGPFY